MAKQKRTQLEITRDILTTMLEGVKKPTRIMYGCNLSWKPMQARLKDLIERGFVDKIKVNELNDRRTHTHYEVTPKGSQWLVTYKELIGEL